MIPLFEPKLRQNFDRTLTIELRLSNFMAELPVPPKYADTNAEGFREFYFMAVKNMMEGLKAQHREKMKLIKRRSRRLGRKDKRADNRRDPKADDGTPTPPLNAG